MFIPGKRISIHYQHKKEGSHQEFILGESISY